MFKTQIGDEINKNKNKNKNNYYNMKSSEWLFMFFNLRSAV